MRQLCVLLMVLTLSLPSVGQEEKVAIHFADPATDADFPGTVNIVDQAGRVITHTDSKGYAFLTLQQLEQSACLVALSRGYKPDTIRKGVTTIYLHRLEKELGEVIISGNDVHKLLQEPDEYVVDYLLTGSNIVAATYSGNNGGHGKLFLLNKDGREVAKCLIPYEPLMLYKSCAGVLYCVCNDQFFSLDVTANDMVLKKAYDIKFFPGLEECEISAHDNRYYRMTDRDDFRVGYAMLRKGDSVFTPVCSFAENNVARASFDEWMEIEALLASGQRREAARKQLARLGWDRLSFSHINMPIINKNDTLVIFDFFKKEIKLLDLNGNSIADVPIHFEWRQSQLFNVLQDEVTGNIYVHRYEDMASQTIESLNIATGYTSSKMRVERPFAEQVKIYNGDIYMLWQDKNAATRQLFIQKAPAYVTAK